MLWPLAVKLRVSGFNVEIFAYASLKEGTNSAAQRLCNRLKQSQQETGKPAHLIGHSLGGMVCLLAAQQSDVPIGRIVCLGSPLTGSASAKAVHGRGLGFGMGRSAETLLHGFDQAPSGRDIGVIAGTRAAGIGRLFRAMRGPSDGTVSVAETQLPGIRDHVIAPVSHMELLLSRQVADLTASFLRDGAFPSSAR